MKKILILGATEHSRHIIDVARRMGVQTIVTDYVKGNPAKAYADKAYDISTLDVPALIELCKKERVDGVLAGYVDINLVPYYKVCKAMGYPCYCDEQMVSLTMNKKHFKDLCRQFKIEVPADIVEEQIRTSPDSIPFPVIVKPADSYSSKGISVCNSADELLPAVEKAYSFSTCNEIVIEEFISAPNIDLYFTVQNGQVHLSAMADRTLREEAGCAPQPEGYRFPSQYIDVYLSGTHAKVQKMMEQAGMQNGTFFLQGFVRDNSILFFEMGLRLSGGCGYIHIENQCGFNQIEMYIQYALTGTFGTVDLKTVNNPRFVRPAYTFVVLLKPGKIARIEGLEKIHADDSYIDMIQLKHEGDELGSVGTLNQVFARIYLAADTWEKIDQSVKNIKNCLRVINERGETMLYYNGNSFGKIGGGGTIV